MFGRGAPDLGQQPIKHIPKNLRIAPVIGIGQSRPSNIRVDAKMIKRLSGASHSGFNRTQRMVTGQLPEKQRDELAPRPQFSDAVVSLMSVYGF